MSGEIKKEFFFKSKRDLVKQKSDNSILKRSVSVFKTKMNPKRVFDKEPSDETQQIEVQETHRAGCPNGLRQLRRNRRQIPQSSLSQDKMAKNSKTTLDNNRNEGIPPSKRRFNCFCSKMERDKQNKDKKVDLKLSRRCHIVKNFDNFSKRIYSANGKLSEETINKILETIKNNLERTNDKNKTTEKKEVQKYVSIKDKEVKVISNEFESTENKPEIIDEIKNNQTTFKKKRTESSAYALNHKNVSKLNLMIRSRSQPVKINGKNKEQLQIINEDNEEDCFKIVHEKSKINFDKCALKKVKSESNNCLVSLSKREVKEELVQEKEEERYSSQVVKSKNGLKSKSPFKDRFTVELKSVNDLFKKELSCNITFCKK